MNLVTRCALYTRKSTEEGLDQAFNSLDAQREACEAYVKSQKGEGWLALNTAYDDGGYSGGTMERSALQRLLADIDVGKVDVVVVYKIDRLTRSLADFARMVDLFDRHGVNGLHPAIVDTALFEAVQAKLDANARRHADCTSRVTRAPLTGRIFDSDGQPMSPSFTYGKRGQVYRYYVSAPLLQGRRPAGDTGIRRVPGPALETIVSSAVRRLAPASAADPLSLPSRVEIHAESLQVLLPIALLAAMRARLEDGETDAPDAAEPGLLRLALPIRMRLRGGRTWIIGGARPTSRRDPVLIRALRTAHAMIETDATSHPTLDAAPASSYRRRLVRLAFLAPDLQRAILAGQQPPGLTLESLLHSPMPNLWSDQAAMIEALGLHDAMAQSEF